MKSKVYLLLAFFSASILYGCSYFGWAEDPDSHKVIVFENNSEQEVFVDYYSFDESNYNYMLSRCIIGALDRSFVKAGEVSKEALKIPQFEYGKVNYWEWQYYNKDHVYFLIADAEMVRQRIQEGKLYGEYSYDYQDWPEESADSPLLAVYILTLDDLNNLDWTLSYPPDDSMRPESIVQR
jgi:hypothetical protein